MSMVEFIEQNRARIYNIDQLASKDYLGKLIGMMDDVLTVKTGI